MLKEKNFKKMRVVKFVAPNLWNNKPIAVRCATKFFCAFSYDVQNYILVILVNILKLADAVYIAKYMNFQYYAYLHTL